MEFKSTEASEVFNGENQRDFTVNYGDSPTGIKVNTDHPSPTPNSGGYAEGDILKKVNNLIGSPFDDKIVSSRVGTLQGGMGNDHYVVILQNKEIKVIEMTNEGIDKVETDNNEYQLEDNIENLTHNAPVLKPFIGHGNELDNTITGGHARNTLYGHGGNDILIGGDKDDILLGGDGKDELIGGKGKDTASYLDSPTGITFNFITGGHDGYASGDKLSEMEVIEGTKYSDTFIADSSSSPPFLIGTGGIDIITYAQQDSPATIKVSGLHYQIETIEGTRYSDDITGGVFDDNIIGGLGADNIHGWVGNNSAWYVNSPAAVTVDLQTGTGEGGEAEGDRLSWIHNLKGSSFNDTLKGDEENNLIEGGPGNDTIFGGGGNDTLCGNKDPRPYTTYKMGTVSWQDIEYAESADIIHGGAGNDTIYSSSNIRADIAESYSSENDVGSIAYGDSGDDVITVFSATAYGGEGNDKLYGYGPNYSLYGDTGDDRLSLYTSGFADGGEGSDTYYVASKTLVTIKDSGKGGRDTLIIRNVKNTSDIYTYRDGDDVYIFSATEVSNGEKRAGVILKDWHAGVKGIEAIVLANDQVLFQIFSIYS